MSDDPEDELESSLVDSAALLAVVLALCVLAWAVLAGCAIAIGDGSRADTKVNVPVEVEAKNEREKNSGR